MSARYSMVGIGAGMAALAAALIDTPRGMYGHPLPSPVAQRHNHRTTKQQQNRPNAKSRLERGKKYCLQVRP